MPNDSLSGHLTFALKYEGIDLAVLKKLFEKICEVDIISLISSEPIGQYSRKIWFIFPVSAIILERLDEYRHALESYSQQRLDLIKWVPANDNVAVLNHTIDLYRYFDATRQAEFLYSCVQDY